MCSEGTTKWDMYGFMAGDREQQEAGAAEEAAARTASVPAPSVQGRTTAHARLHPRRRPCGRPPQVATPPQRGRPYSHLTVISLPQTHQSGSS
jgi:hypothetical protein